MVVSLLFMPLNIAGREILAHVLYRADARIICREGFHLQVIAVWRLALSVVRCRNEVLTSRRAYGHVDPKLHLAAVQGGSGIDDKFDRAIDLLLRRVDHVVKVAARDPCNAPRVEAEASLVLTGEDLPTASHLSADRRVQASVCRIACVGSAGVVVIAVQWSSGSANTRDTGVVLGTNVVISVARRAVVLRRIRARPR